MLSVNINVLKEAESVLSRESAGIQEIKNRLEMLRKQLLNQKNQVFFSHALSVKRLMTDLDQEISDIEALQKSLISIEQAYSDCERKNITLEEQNRGISSSYLSGVSENPWKSIYSAVYGGVKVPFLSYEISKVNQAYSDLIQPLLGDVME